MRKLPVLLSLLFFSFSTFIFPKESDNNIQKDEEGLLKVCEAISANKITKGDFRQLKFILKLRREMVSSGIFIISANDGILWNTQKPYRSTMAMTKKSIIQTNSKGKKTVLSAESNATFEQFASVLSAVFNGNSESLTKNFDIEFIGDASNWNINLVPKNSSVRRIIEEIDMAGHNEIDVMTIHESNGDYIRYEFQTHIHPSSLSDEEKSFFSEK